MKLGIFMYRTNKWRIGIAVCEYYMVDVESFSEVEAEELAYDKIKNNPNDYVTSTCSITTSIFLNDKESRGFVPFISDYTSGNEEISDFL